MMWLLAVVLLLVHVASSSWLDVRSSDVDEYTDSRYDSATSSARNSLLLNMLLNGMPQDPLSDVPTQPKAPKTIETHQRRKKTSVAWLLTAALQMCQKQPEACLGVDFSNLDPNTVNMIMEARSGR